MTSKSGQRIEDMRARLEAASERLERARVRLLRQQIALMEKTRRRTGSARPTAAVPVSYGTAQHA